MASHKVDRERLLIAVYRSTGGSLQRCVCASDFPEIGESPETIDSIIVPQLVAKKWLEFDDTMQQTPRFFRITMDGIEEAEKMERSAYKRFGEEHPLLYDIARGVAILVAGTMILLAFGLKR